MSLLEDIKLKAGKLDEITAKIKWKAHALFTFISIFETSY